MTDQTSTTNTTRMALVTGGSAGLGRALVGALAADGWDVLTDGRSEEKFKEADLPAGATVLVGDVTDAEHRERLVEEVRGRGRLDLLVHNASTLGPLPMRPLAEVDVPDLQQVWRTNIGGPLVLTSALLPWLREADGVLLSISTDAAVHHYGTWGLYGASKAALDHLTLTYAAETALTGYAVDPGDMRTAMHQDAFPGEDISDRPLPETTIPFWAWLLGQDRAVVNGRRFQAQADAWEAAA